MLTVLNGSRLTLDWAFVDVVRDSGRLSFSLIFCWVLVRESFAVDRLVSGWSCEFEPLALPVVSWSVCLRAQPLQELRGVGKTL